MLLTQASSARYLILDDVVLNFAHKIAMNLAKLQGFQTAVCGQSALNSIMTIYTSLEGRDIEEQADIFF